MKSFKKHEYLFILCNTIKNFFKENDILEVITPPMVTNPGMEVHVHPFAVYTAKNCTPTNYYLHTSPEFHMKELLALGYDKIFTLSYCFRDDIRSDIHRNQFLMLEWYRANARYEEIMTDCELLLNYVLKEFRKKNIPIRNELQNFKEITLKKMTVQELLLKHLNIDILKYLDSSKMISLLKDNFPHIHIPNDSDNILGWDDYFFLLFLHEIEPHIKEYPFLLLYEFPAPLSALSTLKASDTRVCERFEIYSFGIELCNAYNELTKLDLQEKRFYDQMNEKERIYKYRFNDPGNVLFDALKKGIPPSGGIALGVERLLKIFIDPCEPFWD